MTNNEDAMDVREALTDYLDTIEASGFECYEDEDSLLPICRCYRDDPLINCDGNQNVAGMNPCRVMCKPFVIAGYQSTKVVKKDDRKRA